MAFNGVWRLLSSIAAGACVGLAELQLNGGELHRAVGAATDCGGGAILGSAELKLVLGCETRVCFAFVLNELVLSASMYLNLTP